VPHADALDRRFHADRYVRGRSLQSVLEESRAIAHELWERTAETPKGAVYEERLRRIDLCADVAGWASTQLTP
jgi:hypothetical protein